MVAKKEPKPKKSKKNVVTSAPGDVGKSGRDINEVIKQLDVGSLSRDDLIALNLHCASALNLRNAIDNPKVSLARTSAQYCYTKSGEDDTVTVYCNGFPHGEISEEEAKARGIRPCG